MSKKEFLNHSRHIATHSFWIRILLLRCKSLVENEFIFFNAEAQRTQRREKLKLLSRQWRVALLRRSKSLVEKGCRRNPSVGYEKPLWNRHHLPAQWKRIVRFINRSMCRYVSMFFLCGKKTHCPFRSIALVAEWFFRIKILHQRWNSCVIS